MPEALGALNARGGVDYGAPVGRGVKFLNARASSLEGYAKLVAEALARRDFERARELIDEAVRVAGPLRGEHVSPRPPGFPGGALASAAKERPRAHAS